MTSKEPEPNAESWYAEGCRLSEAGKTAEAVIAFTAAIDARRGWAEAHLKRGVCYYRLGDCRLAAQDLEAAGLLGCQAALFWCRYDVGPGDDYEND